MDSHVKNLQEFCGSDKDNSTSFFKNFIAVARRSALLGTVALLPLVFAQKANAQIVPSANNSTLTPFSCENSLYEVIENQLSVLDPTQNPGVYTSIGSPATGNYNATGYNENDNYIYGISNDGSWGADVRHLIRVGSDGSTEVLVDLSAEITAAGGATGMGVMVSDRLYFGTGRPDLSYVDTVTGITGTQTFTGSLPPGNMVDYAYNVSGGENIIIGIRSGVIYRYNLDTSTVTSVDPSISGLPNHTSWGAAWSTNDGLVYFSSNSNGTIYIIEGVNTATPSVIAEVSAVRSSRHDGMNCYIGGNPFDFVPELTVSKTASVIPNNVKAGDAITYTFEVENTGTIDISNVVPVEGGITFDGAAGTGTFSAITIVTESGFVSTDVDANNQVDVLEAGQSAKFEAIYTVSQADLNAMFTASDPLTAIDNSATATGTPTIGALAPVTPSVVETGVSPAPNLTIAKLADDDTERNVGDVITYTYTVENTGNVIIDDVSIDDQHTSSTGTSSLPVADETGAAGNSAGSSDASSNDGTWDLLAPGDSVTFTSSYVVTAADITAGNDITNSATANGSPSAGTLTPPTVEEIVTLASAPPPLPPALPPLVPGACHAVEGEAYLLDGLGIGGEQNYQLASGSTTHDPDVFFGALGAEVGYVKNADGSVSYYFDGEAPAETNSSTVNSIGLRNIAAVTGSAADQTDAAEFWRAVARFDGVPGQSYNFNLDNGNAHEFIHYWVEDSSGNVIDSSLGKPNTANGWTYGTGSTASTSGPNPIASQGTTPISYTIPASSTDGIVYVHILVLDPQVGWGRLAFSGEPECPDPSLAITKVADDATDRKPGETITYTYTVENTGNIDTNDITVTDVHNGSGALSAITIDALTNASGNSSDDGADNVVDVLAPNDSVTFVATYVVTEADVIAGGDITNTATVTGDPVIGELPSTPITADESVTVAPLDVELSLTKTNTPGVNGEVDQAADTLTSGDNTTYTVVVTNNGPDSVTGAVVTDTVGAGLTCPATNAVTLAGNGVPSGSFTIGDLTGAGITLQTLADGQSVTLTYTCEVN